jgi:hypothetical protein
MRNISILAGIPRARVKGFPGLDNGAYAPAKGVSRPPTAALRPPPRAGSAWPLGPAAPGARVSRWGGSCRGTWGSERVALPPVVAFGGADNIYCASGCDGRRARAGLGPEGLRQPWDALRGAPNGLARQRGKIFFYFKIGSLSTYFNYRKAVNRGPCSARIARIAAIRVGWAGICPVWVAWVGSTFNKGAISGRKKPAPCQDAEDVLYSLRRDPSSVASVP